MYEYVPLPALPSAPRRPPLNPVGLVLAAPLIVASVPFAAAAFLGTVAFIVSRTGLPTLR